MRTCSASRALRVLSWWQASGAAELDVEKLARRDSRRSCGTANKQISGSTAVDSPQDCRAITAECKRSCQLQGSTWRKRGSPLDL